MATTKSDYVFPITPQDNDWEQELGMTKREYFAAKVLQGAISNNEMFLAMCLDRNNCARDKDNDSVEDYVAQQCYKMADAMLKESNQ